MPTRIQRRPLRATAAPYSAMDEPRRSAATCNLETALTQPKQPSGQCLLRLNHDPKNIIDNPVPEIFVEPEKGNVTYVHAVIVGPDNTPCQGGLILLSSSSPSTTQPVHRRVAISDALEACLLGNSLYPQDLPMAVIKHFVEHFDKYESVALSLLGGHSSVEESQQYAVLLERQQDLHGHILQNNPTMRKMLHSDYNGIMNC
ncbi:hypothetical protein HPB51_001823 [Rhipicephalus microplus]|uniref:Uncharacterized protein n=1 Tax=Rhipicephalus microplus TaxID=6941 RepID=A0A9J6EWH6_RHIMP|nr:hypothetical protein HPB51_001823 [Rhipicephalus microplus]